MSSSFLLSAAPPKECPRPSELASVLNRLQGIISGTTYQRLLVAIDEISSDAYERGLADGARQLAQGEIDRAS
jgi:hypothetical protein